MNKVAAFALQRKNSILSMSEKMFCPPQPLRLVWITPACAGKSSRNETCWHRPWDHPCVCREKRRNSRDPEVWQGSPPPVRGKDTAVQREPFLAGIPPRVCGEKCPPGKFFFMTVGSPPRMRGKEPGQLFRVPECGITPACAGKSSIQHLTASLGEFKVQKGHPVPHLRQRLQVWPDHARHLRHGLILHASRSAGQGRRLCPGPCPDTAGSGTPRGPSPAKRPHTSPPAATPGGCRPWQSGATAPGSR